MDGVRRVKRPGDTLRGLASAVLGLGIVIGVPVALVLLVGNPIPELPRDALGNQVPIDFVLDVIVCIVWLAWAQLVSCLLVELVAGVRGRGLPWRVPYAAGAQQDFARRLVTAMLLLATAGQGLQSAPTPLTAGPPAVAATATAPDRAAATAPDRADAGADRVAAHRAGEAGPTRADGPAGAAARKAAKATKQYVVMPPQGRHHDSLWDIADRYLGSGIRYRELFELNQGRTQPDGSKLTLESLIRPGWTLIMPADARGEGLIEVTPDRPVSGGLAGAGSIVDPVSGELAGAHGATGGPGAVEGGGAQGSGTSVLAGAGASRQVAGESEEPAPERSPQIPWDLVGAELLAAGLLEALIALRRRRSRLRRSGAAVALPDAEAAGVEVAVRLGADPAGADFLDRALRVLARGLGEQDRPVPELYAARLSTDALELLLAVPQEPAPAPFTAENGGARWVLDRSTPLPDVDGVAAPLPGLVSVGGDGHGRVFVDLEAAGGAVCVTGDLDRARSVVAAAAVELVTNRWSDHMRVTLVGFGSALAPISEDRLRCVDSLAEVLDGVTDRLSASRQALTASGVDSVLTGRVRGLPGDGLTPDFLVLAAPPDPDELAELQSWARSARRAPLGILIAGDVPSARWRFAVDDGGVLDTGVLGLTVGAQLLSARSYAALARLLRVEAAALAADRVAAAAWPPPVAESPVAPELPRPVDPDAEPAVLVRVFGEPAVTGADPGTPLALEIVSYLALTGGVTPRTLAASIWPYGVTVAERDATLSRVADWLGPAADGRPRLRTGEDGRLLLSGEVQLDWHLFVALAQRGTEEDVLRALELARGPLVEPHLPRRYAWVARERVAHELPAYVVDVAHRAAAAYLASGRTDGAVAAARAGLRVDPGCGQLWDDLVAASRERDGEAGAARVIAEQAVALAEPAPEPARLSA